MWSHRPGLRRSSQLGDGLPVRGGLGHPDELGQRFGVGLPVGQLEEETL